MSQTVQEKNKALVLDAFETLFNKRDYAAAEKYWSPNVFYPDKVDEIAEQLPASRESSKNSLSKVGE